MASVSDTAHVPRAHERRSSWMQRLGLTLICVVALLLCARGLTTAVGHPDQMAFQPLFNPDLAPLNPGWFEKPPFHTYFNYFLSVLPIEQLAGALGVADEVALAWQRLWSKILQVLLFVGTLVTFHWIVAAMVRPGTALLLTALLGSSAGLVVHAHFLTADIPVLFWMLLAFAFCQRIVATARWSDYVFAGLLTGIAAAVKYNGIGVGIAIPAAHVARLLFGRHAGSPLAHAFAPKLVVGLACVAAGFVLANPFSVLDFGTFYRDFTYNAAVAPVYEGQTGHSYLQFFVALTETIGIPVFIGAVVAGTLTLWASRRQSANHLRSATVWMAIAVLFLYYAKFAPFPRLEMRFVLPIAPYLLIVAAPGFDWALARFRVVAGLAALLLAYNVACSLEVGVRFSSDARIAGRNWLQTNIPAGASVESDVYSTGLGSQYACCETPMPFVTGRERLFAKLFPGDEFINGTLADQAAADWPVQWFTPAALHARQPSYLVTNSNYFYRFLSPGLRGDLYPSMREYFGQLLDERLGYEIVLDVSTPTPPRWAYPRNIDFLQNRLVVLRRTARVASAAGMTCRHQRQAML